MGGGNLSHIRSTLLGRVCSVDAALLNTSDLSVTLGRDFIFLLAVRLLEGGSTDALFEQLLDLVHDLSSLVVQDSEWFGLLLGLLGPALLYPGVLGGDLGSPDLQVFSREALGRASLVLLVADSVSLLALG